jgi:superfamily II DNA or RNA helicase
MAKVINIQSLKDDEREKISKDLTIKVEQSRFTISSQDKFIYPLKVEKNTLYIPFAYGPYPRQKRAGFGERELKFSGVLRDEQKVIRNEAIDILNETGSVLISLYTGGGKTVTCINVCSKIKLKTLIIVHRIVLVNQWEESIKKFCAGAKIQILSASSEDEDADFYIINAINIPKKSRDFYKGIGVVVVDEAHLIMAEGLSECMLHITPRYVIGLSATPYRHDGLNILFDLYFGTKKIIRKMWHPHIVWKVESGFEPKVETDRSGKINWSALLEEQANNPTRNEMILDIVKQHPDRVFLILCKRVSQARFLIARLIQMGEDVTSLIGTEQQFKKSSRILVGTNSKAGVGFDHDRLDALILAGDIEQYFVQYLGRVFRRKDVKPVIFDIVDNNQILIKHFKTRRAVYIETGGVIKEYVRPR